MNVKNIWIYGKRFGLFVLSPPNLSSINEEITNLKVYPNPFNSNCKIEFELPHDEFLNIDIYSLRGEFIENLFSGKKSKGQHRYHWNVNSMFSDITSGIFFISLTGERINATRKILYLK